MGFTGARTTGLGGRSRVLIALGATLLLVLGMFGFSPAASADPSDPSESPSVNSDPQPSGDPSDSAEADQPARDGSAKKLDKQPAAPAADPPDMSKFQKVVMAQGTHLGEVMELTVAEDGRVFFITRGGDIQLLDPETGSVDIIMNSAELDVWSGLEDGLLGITLDPDFAENNWIWVYYAPNPEKEWRNRLSRLTLSEDADGNPKIEKSSEKILLEVATQREACCHSAGSLQFDKDGILFLSTGDNTSSSDNDGYSPHDERPGRYLYDSQKGAGNTNDLRGSVLRVIPRTDDNGDIDPAAGDGISYDIPAGNLFGEGGQFPEAKYPDADPAKTRPEKFVMGVRNPYRLGVDMDTSTLYWGEVGPDANSSREDRGPERFEEFNRTDEAMNGGWPYCIGQTNPDDLSDYTNGGSYVDWDFVANKPRKNADGSYKHFPCTDPEGMKGVNDSPNNTGLADLPPATDAWIAYANDSGMYGLNGTTAIGGKVYRQSQNTAAKDTAFPAYFEGSYFMADMSRGWIKEVRMNEDGSVASVNNFLGGFTAPGDVEFGADGSMYVVEYGTGFFSGSPQTKITRVDYAVNGLAPSAKAAATPSEGAAPLAVSFSSAGSADPDGGALKFSWDFDGDGSADSTEANPKHTFTAPGDYAVTLTVTDPTGKSAKAQVIVNVGNTAPKVKINAPIDGGFVDAGDDLKFDVTVTDAEEEVNCDQVVVTEGLGHDSHAHPGLSVNGCKGVIATAESANHGADANTYGVIMAKYKDHGANGGANDPLTGEAQIITQPKLRQAEHTLSTDRSGVNQTGYDDKSGTRPGGGGLITDMNNGDWVMFKPMSLSGMDSIDVTYSQNPAADAKIEVRAGAKDGPVVASIPLAGNSGGLYFYKTVNGKITSREADAGGRPLYFVYTGGGSIALDEFKFNGRGIANNVRPTITKATATPDDGVAPLKVDFAAEANDGDGDAITYAWNFGVEGAEDDVATGATASYTYAEAGSYTAVLTVTDATGKKTTRNVPVTVRRGCATPSTPDEGYTMLFDGTSTADWKQAGPGKFFLDDCAITSQGGMGMLWYSKQKFDDFSVKMQFKLSRDTDNSGLFARFPDPGNDPWVAINQGHEIQIREGIEGDGEDQKTGSLYNFDREDKRNAKPLGEWNDYEIKVEGQTYTMILNGEVVNVAHSDGSRGIDGFIGLQNHGTSDVVSFRDIQVKELDQQEPFVNKMSRTPSAGPAPLKVDFKVEGIDRQGDEISYEWDFGDGSEPETGGATISHTYTAGGEHTATVTPIDAAGNRGVTREFAPTTAQVDPVPNASATPRCGQAPMQVSFKANATDPQNQTLSYLWDFGVDGATSTEQNPTYTYETAGIYTATLTVSDPDGNTGTQELVIEALAQGDCGVAADLSGVFNNDGISKHDNPGDGNFDGGGWVYAAETLPEGVRETGGPLTIDGTNYVFGSPEAGKKNNVEANGQRITLPKGKFDLLKVLGAAHNGSVQPEVTITYADGSTAKSVLRFSDWAVSPAFGEDLTVPMTHRHQPAGDTGPAVNLFTQNLSLNPNKEVASITLPTEGKLHVFAITAVSGGEGPETPADEPATEECSRSDDFAADTLSHQRWNNVIRPDEKTMKLENGDLVIDTTPGELQDSAKNLVLQKAPNGGLTAITKVNMSSAGWGQQAGLTLENGKGTKFLKVAINDKGENQRWIEFVRIAGATSDFTGVWNSGWLPADFGNTVYLKLTSKDGKSFRGQYSKDGKTWLSAGDPRAGLGVGQSVGVYALHGTSSSGTTAKFSWFSAAPERTECDNLAPTVEATSDVESGPAPLKVAFTATGEDPEGEDLTYAWDFGDGSKGEGAEAEHTYTEPGTYTARVTATDASGATATDTVAIEVTGEQQGKTWVVDAVDDETGNYWKSVDTGTNIVEIEVGDTVKWEFDQATMDHDLTSRDTATAWDPPLRESRPPNGEPVSYTFTEPGTYDYWCSIHGATMTGTVVVREKDGGENQAPTAEPLVDPRTGNAPLAVHFEARAKDADGDELTYLWDFGTGDGADDTSTEEHAHFTYTEPGTYEATLKVSDGKGGEFTEKYPITVLGDGPKLDASASTSSGDAPLNVIFMAGVENPDEGATYTYTWDFGDGSETVTGNRQPHTYTEDGVYHAKVTATDGNGWESSKVFTITVGDVALPEFTAVATPDQGAAPLEVQFSSEVTQTGEFKPFADGTESEADLGGTASMVRKNGQTVTSVEVTGLEPNTEYSNVHVHEEVCNSPSNGGPHFRIDETKPYSEENEIWPTFTTDADGVGTAEITTEQRVGAKTKSIIVHDPNNSALRLGCADLKPSLQGLTYAWDFGDGSTGTGEEPKHTYTEAGEYTATLTASDDEGNTAEPTSVKVTVDGVADTTAPNTSIQGGPNGWTKSTSATFRLSSTETGSTFECRVDQKAWAACTSPLTLTGLSQGKHTLKVRAIDAAGNVDASPATRTWKVDSKKPSVTGVSPQGTIGNRKPTIRATIKDAAGNVPRSGIVFKVDGKKISGFGYKPATGKLTFTKALAKGKHTVVIKAKDKAGNATTKQWSFRIR